MTLKKDQYILNPPLLYISLKNLIITQFTKSQLLSMYKSSEVLTLSLLRKVKANIKF